LNFYVEYLVHFDTIETSLLRKETIHLPLEATFHFNHANKIPLWA